MKNISQHIFEKLYRRIRAGQRLLRFKIEGLNWINQNYYTKGKS